jgi:hypothetical protein
VLKAAVNEQVGATAVAWCRDDSLLKASALCGVLALQFRQRLLDCAPDLTFTMIRNLREKLRLMCKQCVPPMRAS